VLVFFLLGLLFILSSACADAGCVRVFCVCSGDHAFAGVLLNL
jgi:hypothetical protein